MKNKFIQPIAFAALLMISAEAFAQTTSTSNVQETNVSKNSPAQFTLFTGKYLEEKNYLHWEVKNQSCDGQYVIYKSIDGIHFDMLGCKKGVGVSISAPIAYYFQDENPFMGVTYYKLIHISNDGVYLSSAKISVTSNEMFLSETK